MSATMRAICLAILLLFCVSSCAPPSAPGEKADAERMKINLSFQGSEDDKEELTRFLNLTFAMCKDIYPKMTFKECMGNAKHGVGRAFDPHSEFLSAEETKEMITNMSGKFGGVGIEIFKPASLASRVIVVNVLDNTPAKRGGVLLGDVISKIGNIATTSLGGSQGVVGLIRGDPGTSIELTILRRGVDAPIVIKLIREEIRVVQITAELLWSGEKAFALLTARQFNENFSKEMKEKFFQLSKKAGVKLSGLVISVENNPGGLLNEVYNAVDLFLDAESIVLERTNTGVERYEPEGKKRIKTPGDITQGLSILVVVNEASGSAAEILAGALKHFGRAVVAGTGPTFGKGSIQNFYPLPGDEMAKITFAEYLIGTIEDWIPVQCIGVTPDILFTYPGMSARPAMRECELGGRVNSGGLMLGAPMHRAIKDANPELYRSAEDMLEVFKAHRLSKLQEEEAKAKMLEKFQ